MNRDNKEQLVTDLAQKLASAKAAFLADYRGLNVEQVNKLRGELRRFFKKRSGRRPLVLPVLMEV